MNARVSHMTFINWTLYTNTFFVDKSSLKGYRSARGIKFDRAQFGSIGFFFRSKTLKVLPSWLEKILSHGEIELSQCWLDELISKPLDRFLPEEKPGEAGWRLCWDATLRAGDQVWGHWSWEAPLFTYQLMFDQKIKFCTSDGYFRLWWIPKLHSGKFCMIWGTSI